MSSNAMDRVLQLWSVRRSLMFDPHRTMQRIKNNDFNAVEVAGTWGQSKKTFSKMLQEHELSVAGCHIAPPPFDMINSSSEDRGRYCKYLIDEAELFNCRRLAVMRDPRLPTNATQSLVQSLQFCARICEQEGITLMFHPYHYDWLPIDGSSSRNFVWRLIRQTQLCIQLDLYYMALAHFIESAPLRSTLGGNENANEGSLIGYIDRALQGVPPSRIRSLHLNGWKIKDSTLQQTELRVTQDLFDSARRAFGLSEVENVILEHDCLGSQVDIRGVATEVDMTEEWSTISLSINSRKILSSDSPSAYDLLLTECSRNRGRH